MQGPTVLGAICLHFKDLGLLFIYNTYIFFNTVQELFNKKNSVSANSQTNIGKLKSLHLKFGFSIIFVTIFTRRLFWHIFSSIYLVVKDVNTEKGVPIHYDLIGLHQNDPKLIRAIREKVLWPPSTSGKLNLNTKRKNLEQMLKGKKHYLENWK